MIAALLGLALSAAPAHLSADERVSAVLLILSPKRTSSRAPTSAFLEAAQHAFESSTRLRVSSLEQAGADLARVEGCRAEERLTCWVTSIRREEATGASYLLAVSVHPIDDGDRISVMTIDLERALRIVRSGAGDAEDQIFQDAVHTEAVAVRSHDPPALRDYFDGVVHELRGYLAERRHDRPPGSVLVRSSVRAAIHLDGRIIGFVEPGEAIVEQVAPGSRSVLLAAEAERSFQVTVSPARTSTIAWELETSRSNVLEWTMIAAGGVSIAGGIASAIAAALEAGSVRAGCLSRTDACEEGGGITTGFDPDMLPTTDPGAAYAPGVALIPLATALIVQGAIWAAGAWSFFDEEPLWLWLCAAAGVAAGAGAYGIVVAAD
jgi:hypothetical protein